MARLNKVTNDDSDGELVDLGTLLRGGISESPRKAMVTEATVKTDEAHTRTTIAKAADSPSRRTISASWNEEKTRQQRPLGPLKLTHVNSPLLPLSNGSLSCARKPNKGDDGSNRSQQVRSTPRRATSKPVDYSRFIGSGADRGPSISDDDDSFTDLSGFIVPDSDVEEEKPKRTKRKEFQRSSKKHSALDEMSSERLSGGDQRKVTSRVPSEITDLTSPKKGPPDIPNPQSPVLVPSSAQARNVHAESLDLDEPFSRLRFSPPRSRKPSRTKDMERPTNPPASPTKTILDSPFKKHRIPASPHCPSIDAFWSQEVINNWNDQYSPKKPPLTPGGRNKLLSVDGDDEFPPPSGSPCKSPTKSPTKKDRQTAKAFNEKKHGLATTFLAEVDSTIADGRIAELAARTGGIQIVWSKKLSSTAGRANWRREAVRRRSPDGTMSDTTYRNHASIELAEKVIDSEDRLINVLAHEYCHLANFMISGVKDQPHGKEFKSWAAKVTRAFRNRGVEVTTKHGYDISYKYIWTCGECGLEYKRHSKSIAPSKHSCGACKGRLMQILPAPRKESEYQRYVKANWDRVKKAAGEGANMGEINAVLAKEWEARKTKLKGDPPDVKTGDVVVGIVEIEGGDGESDASPELDFVARKLDFLNLGS